MSNPRFEVYNHETKGYAVVRPGFSVWAFLFTWIWAFKNRLWSLGLFYLLLPWALSLAAAFTYPWLSLLFLPFSMYLGFAGSPWKAWGLEKRGFVYCGEVNAVSGPSALALARAGEIRKHLRQTRGISPPRMFQQLFALVWLTWKAAFRFRLFLVVALLLLGAVVGLPLLIEDDGTARGFTQILLTYTLSAISALLGLSTLWLACGTLARDIEDCQMQVVAVKPISRWQIWLGKWLGIVSLNAALLAISGASVYFLLQYRAQHLPEKEQDILRNEVLVARGSARPETPTALIDRESERLLKERLATTAVSAADLPEVRRLLREQVKAEFQLVPPGYSRTWKVGLGMARLWLRDQPLFLRIKFNAARSSPSGTFDGVLQVGVPERTKLWSSGPVSLAPDTFHEFRLPPNLYDDEGVLTVGFVNPNDTSLLFSLDEGMEVLYRQGGFGANFIRGLGIIFCWMALLAAIGLASASFLSFPVAAFFSLSLLLIVGASGTLAAAVADNTLGGYNSETGQSGSNPLDVVAIPVFKALLKVINLAKSFSPVDSLSTGRSITWTELGMAFGQIVLLLGGAFAAFGIYVFHRRELATAQGTQ